MNRHVLAAEKARDQLRSTIGAIADRRLRDLTRWFRREFRDRHLLAITFGNGCDFIEVDGCPVEIGDNLSDTAACFVPPRGPRRRAACLQPVADAIRDVREITSGYKDGCPRDVNIVAYEGDIDYTRPKGRKGRR